MIENEKTGELVTDKNENAPKFAIFSTDPEIGKAVLEVPSLNFKVNLNYFDECYSATGDG